MAVPSYLVELVSTDGATTYDVSQYVRSVSVDRGRSRELDRFEAGSFGITFENRDRYFDPKYTDSTTRTNLHPNPSAEVDVSGYGGSNMTVSRSTLYPKYNTANVLGTCTSTGTSRYVDYSSRIAVTQGNTYTFSVDIYFPGANAGSSTVRLQLYPHNGTSFGSATASADLVITRGSWTRMSVTATATTVGGLPTTSMLPRVLITSSFPSGDTMHLDGSLFEQSSSAGTYFDGGFTDTNYQTYSWTGTAGLSTSTLLQYANPLYGLITPNRGVIITTGSQERFNGFVKNWSLAYDISGESTAIAAGSDAFSFLAQQVFSAQTPISQLSGERIGDLLALPEITWPFGGVETLLDGGQITLQADTIAAGTNALEYLQLVERTEQGFFFVNRFGQLEFKDSASELVTDVVFADDSSDIAYQGVEVIYGTELLYNQANLERLSGTVPAEASNDASIASYGISVFSDSGLLYDTDADLIGQANVLAVKYGEPEYRFNSVTVLLNPLNSTDQSRLLVLDLCDIVQVKFTPNGVGSAITKYARIIGISESMEVDSCSITFKLATLDYDVFKLDSSVSGLLDYNILGF